MGMDEWYTVSPGTGMAYSQRSAVGCARGLEAHTHKVVVADVVCAMSSLLDTVFVSSTVSVT